MNNEWIISRERVCTPMRLSEPVQEQSIELDYTLPDYFPDFFRLLHCSAEPRITAQKIADDAVQYTLTVRLTVLYLAEQSSAVQAVSQTLHFQRSLPLPADADVSRIRAVLRPETAYLNCRAVNPRRIDLRGAVRITAQLACEQQTEVIGHAEGKYLQTRSEPVTFVSGVTRTEKRFTLTEDLTIAETQPAMLAPLREQVRLRVTETRIVAGKLVVKGEADVQILYTAADGIAQTAAVFPFSQIVEQEGLSEQMPCTVTAVQTDRLLTPEANGSGDLRILHLDIQILLQCTCYRSTTAELLSDAYSTRLPCEIARTELSLLTLPVSVTESAQVKVHLTQPDAVLTRIYAAWAIPQNMAAASAENGAVTVSGTVHCCVLAADAENRPLMLETSEPVTWTAENLQPGQELPPAEITSCEYTLTGSDSVTVQIGISCSGDVMQRRPYTLLTEITEQDAPDVPEKEHALRLYFGQAGESLWEIAKRYRTAESAIREENESVGDVLTAPQMLLIPSVR
ncbi:MAG: DUF3794 domain-containing protein [Oscillospiraceae bacterium]|nr:DUF3794 domain-containing protein [Oscillospiraceae bacterium]